MKFIRLSSSSRPSKFPAKFTPILFGTIAALLSWHPHSAHAAVYNKGVGATWNDVANWSNPSDIPNTTGENATFNGAATANNVAQSANRTVPLDGAKTVGSILFNNDLSNFTNTISTGTGGPLTFDEAGSGPSIITTQGAGTGNNTISVATVLNDDLTAVVNNVSATSGSGSLNLTTAISGVGGFTKQGGGLTTFGSGAKTYGGATVIDGGRLRLSLAAQPSATSSFTINSGGQLTIINPGTIVPQTFTFGSGSLNLNGSGPTSGPFAVFPGAIRSDTGNQSTIDNTVVLQSNALLHVEGLTGSLTFPRQVSGVGKLTLAGPSSSANQGQLVLNGANSYQGGSLVAGGNLVASGATATFGTGNVTVDDDQNTATPNARLTITSGVLDAIADNATLFLAGGGAVAGTADSGYADLGTGVNETVGGLFLGGVQQSPAIPTTYGSTTSPATVQNNEYFAGSGVVTVIPEPGVASALIGGFGALLGFRRMRRPS